MPYLVDGNNLVGVSRDFDINDSGAREKLTRVLIRYQRIKKNSVTVVYDGPPADGLRSEIHIGSLHVIYAGPASDADSRIIKTVKSSKNPGSFIVVSSDRRVVDTCKWYGAKTMKSQTFYDDIRKVMKSRAASDELSGELSKTDIDDWKDYFGFSEDDLS